MSEVSVTKRIEIETPTGTVKKKARRWNDGQPEEKWAVKQDFEPDLGIAIEEKSVFPEQNAARVLQYFLEKYTVAHWLAKNGYEVHSVEQEWILWDKYTKK